MSESVLGIVYSKDLQSVLLVKRCDVPIWVFPGGGVDPGEPPTAAVLREIHEESNVEASVYRLSGDYTPLNRMAKHTYVYECLYESGDPGAADETLDARFFPLSDLPKELFSLHQDWLADALENPTGVVCQPIHQVTYCAVLKFALRHPVQFFRLVRSRMS